MDTNEETKNDDIAMKREARRRKILENSKSRLSRITGREPQDENNDGQSNTLDMLANFNKIAVNKNIIELILSCYVIH